MPTSYPGGTDSFDAAATLTGKPWSNVNGGGLAMSAWMANIGDAIEAIENRERGVLTGTTTTFAPTLSVSGGGTAPNFGGSGFLITTTGTAGRYSTSGGFCVGYVSALWGYTTNNGGSGGSGIYQFQLPLLGRTAGDAITNQYAIGVAAVTSQVSGTAVGVVYMTPNGQSAQDGKWAQVRIPNVSSAFTATLPSGSTTTTVNHKLGTAPSSVMVTPKADPNALGGYWADTYTATTFALKVHTAPGANFDFACNVKASTVDFGYAQPWPFGGTFDQINFAFCYPIASV